MNKRDLKQMARETAAAPVDPEKIPVFSREDFRAAVAAVAKEAGARMEGAGGVPCDANERWWQLFLAAFAAQAGWIMAVQADEDRMQGRLSILADIVDYGVKFARARGKIK